MGMFDDVKYSAPCSSCGHTLTEWQTKDTDCVMRTVTPEEIIRGSFYTSCPECRTWNEFTVRPASPIQVIVERYPTVPSEGGQK